MKYGIRTRVIILESVKREVAKVEGYLKKEIEKLPRYGKECNCDNRESVDFVHNGSLFKGINSFCLNCGGHIEN